TGVQTCALPIYLPAGVQVLLRDEAELVDEGLRLEADDAVHPRAEPARGDAGDRLEAPLEGHDGRESLRARPPGRREPGLAAHRHAEAPVVDLDGADAVRIACALQVVEAARRREQRDGRLGERPVEPSLNRVVAQEDARE